MPAELKLTDDLQNQFFSLLEEGQDPTVAADMCGIAYSTLWRWKKKGENAPDLEPWASFSRRWNAAFAAAEAAHVERISRHSASDWRASAWYLEKRRSERYANKIVIEQSAKDRLASDLLQRLREGLSESAFEEVERLLMASCVEPNQEGPDSED